MAGKSGVCVMASIELRYIEEGRDRRGRVKYLYFRHRGRRWRMPSADPLSEAFQTEYRRLLALVNPTDTAPRLIRPGEEPPGSLGAVVRDYLACGAFKQKKPATQRMYRSILDPLAREHGTLLLSGLERRHVRQLRDAKAETPAMANMWLRVIRLLLSWAVDENVIPYNVALKMKLLKGGEWRAWTDAECAAFERRWPSGTMQRRAYALALYTGQRRSDLALMTRAHRGDGLLHVAAQVKTGEEVWIPEHRALTAELDSGETGHMSLLTTKTGRAFAPIDLGLWFADAIDEAGLPEDCVLHGLRKTAARAMAEAGATDGEIMAVLGHRTRAMVSLYTRAAEKKQLARSAIIKLERRGQR